MTASGNSALPASKENAITCRIPSLKFTRSKITPSTIMSMARPILAMLMIVLGVIFERVNFSEGMRQVIAFSLLAGSALFPLAVLLQTYHHGAVLSLIHI